MPGGGSWCSSPGVGSALQKKTGPKHYRYIINSKPVLHYKVNCALTM